MWLLNNSTPFAAERTWVRDEQGAEIWLVAVKASFLIDPDSQLVLDAEQEEVTRVPEFRGDPAHSSLLFESDLVHTKLATDVIFHGHAYSTHAEPATRVDVRLKIATIDKTLSVQGDRRWERSVFGPTLAAPEPFTEMPITYERAFGGTDCKATDPKQHAWEPRNPVGAGFATHKAHLQDELAPNVEAPGFPYRDWRRGQPAGFGPIARHWMPRLALAGTYDDAWEKSRSPLLPADFDRRFYQSVPEDQQVPGFLKGGELVELFSLTPDGYLAFRLPRVTLGFETRFYDGTIARHRANLHTVVLKPDERRLRIVWHSELPCHHKGEKLQATDVFLKKRLRAAHSEWESTPLTEH